ncbi:amidohydrolase [Ruminococcaceae bacterium OttesenSCG-928-D13]|nr:amidohydrolase [Ruminococcaceae bacterium OttesenSCG-928-D13]
MDIIYQNGNIYSIDPENRRYSAVGIQDGKIAFLGNDEQARAIEAARRVDLEGATVLPGFIDSHLHMLNYAFVTGSWRMFDVGSVEAAVEEGRQRLGEKTAAGDWLYGRGWNHEKFTGEKRLLTRHDLDRISTDRPILFIRVCGHIAAVNSRGLEIVLAQAAAKNYMHQIDVENGILSEVAVKLCYDAMEPPSVERLKEMILLAQKDYACRGITSVESDNFLSLPGRDRRSIVQAYRELDAAGALTVRVREQASFATYEDMKAFIDEGHRTGQGGSHYRIGPVKLYQDGSLGARTALLNAPYEGEPDNRGLMIHTPETLHHCVDYACRHGMQMIIHAIGDAASDMVMDTYERVIAAQGLREPRLIVNHVQVVGNSLFARMAKHGILANIQPMFVASDKGVICPLVGPERAKTAYAWRSMLDSGIRCCGSSDSPVEDFDVLTGIQVAVTRDRPGENTGGWHPDQKLSVLEAVRLFTINNAYGAFEEDIKGSLELGKLADLVVLGRDPFTTDVHRIVDIPVLRTVVGGQEVFTA